MDVFFANLAIRAATFDELLSDSFEAVTGQKADADIAGRRLASWCRSCASGDWGLFVRRLAKDGLCLDHVLPRLATVRRKPNAPIPQWVSDSQWIEAAMKNHVSTDHIRWLHGAGEPQAFEHLLAPVVSTAHKLLWDSLPKDSGERLADSAIARLSHTLLQRLAELTSPALYNYFISKQDKNEAPGESEGSALYDHFIGEMRENGIRNLFEDRPVLLRLIASVTRQWIETTRQLVLRLNSDYKEIFGTLLRTSDSSIVKDITGGIGDLHNGGQSVQLIQFEGGSSVLYKPKSLEIDAQWSEAIGRLNLTAPFKLRTAMVLARDGYGWSEFIAYTDCSQLSDLDMFFRRAGAWLCLFHIFAGNDMHEENMIAAGDHPVPIDLETILQPEETDRSIAIVERHAYELAGKKVTDSILMTGLLPAYGRTPDNVVFGHGGFHDPKNLASERSWANINTDSMKPVQRWKAEIGLKNAPTFAGQQVRLGDYVGALVDGYEVYAQFLSDYRELNGSTELFGAFTGLKVRKLLRPTRFYALLLERIRDYRNMRDGVEWSVHLDFITRLMDWDKPADPWWPLLKAERVALAELNIPHFTAATDSGEISDTKGIETHTDALPGLPRAIERFDQFDREEVAWQSQVVRLSTSTVLRSGGTRSPIVWPCTAPDLRPDSEPDPLLFAARASEISRHLAKLAIRSGPGAAWVGLDWLRDSEVCNLAPLGGDLYGGAPGVCVFLAAQARVNGDEESRFLALAGIASLRHELKSVNAARFARALGVGGSSGLGSVVYAFSVISELLNDDALLDDARNAAALFTSDLIAADKSFDVMDGSAGAILGLLRLYRSTGDQNVLGHASKCGDHLLHHIGYGTERGVGLAGLSAGKPLFNGFSHGAAGFAYAFGSLAAASGRAEFREIALACISHENANYNLLRGNWPDSRKENVENDAFWPCQWCHGAGGIGLARVGMFRQLKGGSGQGDLETDICRAVDCALSSYPYPFDTWCCGNLGNIELLNEVARCSVEQSSQSSMQLKTLQHSNLRGEAARRLQAIVVAADSRGDYLWDVGDKQFNLGLFRGVAGVGYSLLRQLDPKLPSILIWE